jgi:hypothetical protein
MAANAFLRALAKAARSILLYDPSNEAVKNFIDEFRGAGLEALALGAMHLEIRPFEILLGREIVYLERDRERSVAFRMFRDGVRRLTIEPEVSWEELFHLLEILSIRYTGVRQSEDDIVTLLWKAGFQHISIVAVEGFVPEEDGGGAGETSDAPAAGSELLGMQQAAGRVDVPSDWDLPLQDHRETTEPLVYREPAIEDLKAAREEIGSIHLAERALRLLWESLVLVRDPADPTSLTDLYHYIGEVRDFLLSEGQIVQLVRLARELRAMDDLVTRRLQEELRRLADESALRRILQSISRSATEAPDELMELLELVPGDHLAALVAILQVERGAAPRRVARQLIERYVIERLDYLRGHLDSADARVAGDILAAVGAASPALGLQLASLTATRPESEIQRRVLAIANEVDPAASETELLLALVDSPELDVRMVAYEKLGQRGDRRAFRRLLQLLERETAPELEEGAALGRALARVNARRAYEEFQPWIRPPGWWSQFKARNARPELHQWTAVAAFGQLATTEAEEALVWLAKRAGHEVREHCKRALHAAREEGGR